ncbi:MAG: signal peptidase I [Bdellovibrionales bacterium RIFCSPHIGHO2_01_FULL_40_29]|nr:MAG: signal peptidase I [Bdellovibrionales bacterium RIFCSPHIGHO2_01_FULL_40_29]OFZ35458.1 MAG: signal peptidase I [Bdellovibrionales bacterium RIFCSPHIGHO2_02_FULL_40_15]
MNLLRKKIGKQGTWPKALLTFLTPLFLIFLFRWVLFEPFVIPSESMVPNLLVHDHIVVKKYSYGIKPPWGDGWIWRYREPQRGDVVVFRFPENRDVFFIKRLIGLPGDELIIQNGQIAVNNKPWSLAPLSENSYSDETIFNYYSESSEDVTSHTIRLFKTYEHLGSEEKKITVPQNSYFVMGDNRDQSQDSRFWGFVPAELLVGQASRVWMSCEETLASAPFICDPFRLRSDRFFKTIK